MSEDTRNMLMATALALAFLVGWQFFIAPKLSSPQPAATQAAAPATPGAAATPALPGAAVPALSAPTREAALAGGKRVKIDTPALSGSINLVGGRIDDVTLKNYRETTDPKSPNIVLFSPVNAPQPYYADFGWLPDAGASAKPPGADALWAADGDALTPAKPLTLTYDAGGGLTFKRVISVDDRYMFTVEDSATNSGATAASLHPFGMIVRQGTPKVLGYAVLFEGMLADLGQSGLLEINYPGIEKETGATKSFSGDGGFLGFTDAYWAAALIPDQKAKVDARFAATGPVNLRTYAADFLGEAKTLASGQTVTVTTRLFAGAKKVDLIDGYAAKFNISHFDLMIDWGWFYFITKPLFKLLDFLNKFLGNFGLAVLALTVIVKAAFFPIANASYRSMAKMKAVQPEIEAIKTRFPDDRQAQQQAQMEL
ncbi:MAG: membrane protein insertase YidC, partial [Hyphomicrobiales bacterium]|nr:membrane protein insertase YidC [Hyphomicrobiales bacterium]